MAAAMAAMYMASVMTSPEVGHMMRGLRHHGERGRMAKHQSRDLEADLSEIGLRIDVPGHIARLRQQVSQASDMQPRVQRPKNPVGLLACAMADWIAAIAPATATELACTSGLDSMSS